ncbi:MAG: tripartite tricarboxylate transporter substrate binding protein [Ottowia sp.]|uniref:Bug family tripartite tricarboxylate transporter substrate binding protein n=1 Tax=Ottowia sp. TaxID=1898956 RepID=UPI003C752279
MQNPACIFVLAAASVAATLAIPANADTFPSKPITLIVPYAPGSPPDQYSRRFAERFGTKVGQKVVIENRPGALTTIGMAQAARAKPDGYTMVYGSNSSLAAAPYLFKKIAYDPIKDFSAIAVTYESPMILIGRPEDGKLGLAGMLERMRKEPGKHPIGGAAITQEVINKMLQKQAGIEQPYARYSGANIPTDVIGGSLSMGINALSGLQPLVESGKLHVFAFTSAKRLPGKWSQVPTVAETLPGFELSSWVGFWVPSGTPKPVIDFLYAKTAEVINEPDFKAATEETGAATVHMTPAETDAYVKTEGPRWQKLLRDAGIEAQ